ncbi:Nucleolar protein 8 [Auxenochlorella protothecoides]|uniref:Nucleolar protein 8 n=1 Tax=Auxenochlorella protothecoides TaxID=3075 RepID=A0A087SU80_AUXPR|nr:Nucleolar protein 8 [Auxenochlorella protothecoides]KFM29284.1 Nucleolar protein 8 [Auxenochlorella protothecoides]
MVDPVRLCVSGLAPGVTPSELEARFHPFGSVLSCEMIAPKVYDSVEFHRGLAYVTLTPKDPAALANCLAVYNGCKWRGGVLRCAPACPDYRERLRMMQSDEVKLFEADASVDPSGAEELEPESPAVLRLKGQTYGEVVTIASAGNGSHQALEAAPPVTIVHALLDKFAGSSDEEERMPFDPADLLPSASDSSGASELAEFLAGEEVTERDGVPDWLAAAFPAGATFFRSEPLAMVEATWRVKKEAWTLDYKSKNRQAVRQAGKGGKYKRART